MFRALVEVVIDQERKKSGKPAAFQNNGNANAISTAVLKLLKRRVKDI
jgi:hypothetical protein